MSNEIYKIGLHGKTFYKPLELEIIRVPGGWIYNFLDWESGEVRTSVFVPYNNEFQNASQ